MIVPPVIERAEAAASRLWQLIFRLREFELPVAVGHQRWVAADAAVRRWQARNDARSAPRRRLAEAQRLGEDWGLRGLAAGIVEVLDELTREAARARRAGASLDRRRDAQPRSDVAAALWAARPLARPGRVPKALALAFGDRQCTMGDTGPLCAGAEAERRRLHASEPMLADDRSSRRLFDARDSAGSGRGRQDAGAELGPGVRARLQHPQPHVGQAVEAVAG